MNLLYLKAAHFFFVFCWFTGLFYILHIYTHFSDRLQKLRTIPGSSHDPQLTILSTISFELWWKIATPAMLGATASGVALAYFSGYGSSNWLGLKLVFLIGLYIQHLACGWIEIQLRSGKLGWTPSRFFILKQCLLYFLSCIVFLAVIKSPSGWLAGSTFYVAFFLVRSLVRACVTCFRGLLGQSADQSTSNQYSN